MNHHSDTIAAIATPPGHGGIAIVRVSGPGARMALERLFRPAGPGFTGRPDFRPRHMHYGRVYGPAGALLDEVLAVWMPGPHSATGEDVGEIHCHGGPGIAAALLEAVLTAGARLAEAGEFTRRAFLNGRMDLTQAEAVNELIHAPTREGARLAAAKLGGALGNKVDEVREALHGLRVRLTLSVDFPDEEASSVDDDGFDAALCDARGAIAGLLGAYERARLWREGALAVLAGRVNAGKSSLLNALVGRDRAIVSDVPGTTRDYIEETVSLSGLPVRVVDTAGLRRGGGLVEEEGIRRSGDLAADADLLLFVVDGKDLGLGLRSEERDFLKKTAALAAQGRLLLVINKMDAFTPDTADTADAVDGADAALPLLRRAGLIAGDEALLPPGTPIHFVAAKFGAGIDALCAGMREALLGTREAAGAGDLAPNLRQSALLRTALAELDSLREALAAGETMDLLGFRLDAATAALAGVTGAVDNEAVLNSIFESFCIGK